MSNIRLFISQHKSALLLIAFVEILICTQAVACYIDVSHSKRILLLAAVAMVIVAGLGFLFIRKNTKKVIDRIFLAAVLVLGCFYLAVFPPNSVPDEAFHFQASYKFSDVLLGEHVNDTEITIRNEDACLFDDYRTKVSETHYQDIVPNQHFFAQEDGTQVRSVYSSFGIDANLPQMKAPSVLGITLGRFLGLGAYPVYYLGRLFSLITFALLSYFALKLTPIGRSAFVVIPLLPMSLHLAASYSYDVTIIGMGLLLASLCLKAIFEKGYISNRLLIGIGILIFLLAPCKVIYSAIALLVLFIPKERFKNKNIGRAIKAGLLLLVLVSVAVIRFSSLLTLSNMGAEANALAASETATTALNTRGAETGTFYSLSAVLADPMNVILMYIATFDILGAWLIETALGSSLGWFQPEIAAPNLITYTLIVLVLIASLKSDEDKDIELPGKVRFALIAIVLAVCVLVGASMLLGHTFIGENYIHGIQGRYILPAAVLLLIALRNNKIVYKGNQTPVIIFSMVALNLLYLIHIYAVALTL